MFVWKRLDFNVPSHVTNITSQFKSVSLRPIPLVENLGFGSGHPPIPRAAIRSEVSRLGLRLLDKNTFRLEQARLEKYFNLDKNQ